MLLRMRERRTVEQGSKDIPKDGSCLPCHRSENNVVDAYYVLLGSRE